MVDNVNPTSQFHPYQPTDVVPQSERPTTTGLGGLLSKLGLDESLKNVNVRGQLDKARSMAQKNPSLVLGGLAALAIGAGLLRRRGMAR